MTISSPQRHSGRNGRRVVISLLGVWIVAQILIPMRHHPYPGDTSWAE